MVHGAVRAYRAGASADRIVFLGHATLLLELDGVRLLTDPLLRGRVAAPAPPRLRWSHASVTAGPDAVLISHLHHDHLDLASLRLARLRYTAARARRRGRMAAPPAIHDGDRAERGRGGERRCAHRSPRSRPVTMAAAARAGRAPRRSATSCAARIPSTSPATPSSSQRCQTSQIAIDAALLPIGGWGPTLGPGHMDAARRGPRRAFDTAPPGHSDALGHPAADRSRPPPPGPSWRPGAPVRPARRRAGPGSRGAVVDGGAGNDALTGCEDVIDDARRQNCGSRWGAAHAGRACTLRRHRCLAPAIVAEGEPLDVRDPHQAARRRRARC